MSTHNIPCTISIINIIIINIKKKTTEKYPKHNNVCSYGICLLGPKDEFEIAVVKEPSVFELLKFYCIFIFDV